jgi:polyisoprenyl-teichoic acid--peptidoglycan teichoic acid transferase
VRRLGRRVGVAFVAVSLLMVGLVEAAVVATRHMLSAGAQQATFVVTRNQAVNFTGMGDDPVFMLVLGTDDRPGTGGARGDAIHVVGINPAKGEATFINIPRDTFVEFPGGGRRKINEGNPIGGLELQTQVVSELVGVPIAFTVQTNFAGFVGMVDALGGVDVDVPFNMRDSFSGASFNAGLQTLDGDAALAFSRNRHIGGGDVTRSSHQALVLMAALAKVQASHPDAMETLRLVRIFLDNSAYLNGSVTDLVRLARLAQTVDLSRSRSETLPSTTANIAGASVVLALPEAQDLFADFRDNAVLDTWGITFGGGG